jgi:hypothetical protein
MILNAKDADHVLGRGMGILSIRLLWLPAAKRNRLLQILMHHAVQWGNPAKPSTVLVGVCNLDSRWRDNCVHSWLQDAPP